VLASLTSRIKSTAGSAWQTFEHCEGFLLDHDIVRLFLVQLSVLYGAFMFAIEDMTFCADETLFCHFWSFVLLLFYILSIFNITSILLYYCY